MVHEGDQFCQAEFFAAVCICAKLAVFGLAVKGIPGCAVLVDADFSNWMSSWARERRN
jgi:hypothetical protein